MPGRRDKVANGQSSGRQLAVYLSSRHHEGQGDCNFVTTKTALTKQHVMTYAGLQSDAESNVMQ